VKPNFRALGRRFGARTPAVAAAVLAVPAADIASVVLAGGSVSVAVDSFDDPVVIGADDVIVTQTPRAGWAVATDAGETVAVDITVSPELLREGLAREVIRLVQEARKNDGLDVTDRIWLRWSSSVPDVAQALTEHAELIAGEVLAVDFGPGAAPAASPAGTAASASAPSAPSAPSAAWEHVEGDLGLTFWIGRA
jgi:isoleucyl-tRNA synthetase